MGLTLGESLTCFEEGSAAARFANIWLFSLPFLPPPLVLVKAKVLFYLCGSFCWKRESWGECQCSAGKEKEKGERLHKMESKGHLRGEGERVKNGRL